MLHFKTSICYGKNGTGTRDSPGNIILPVKFHHCSNWPFTEHTPARNFQILPSKWKNGILWLTTGHNVISKKIWIPMTYTADYQVGISSNTVLPTYMWRYLVLMSKKKAAFENFCGYFSAHFGIFSGSNSDQARTIIFMELYSRSFTYL